LTRTDIPVHTETTMGRPPSENPLDARIILRLLSEERAAWQQAAKANGKSLSAWLRDLANAAAKRSRSKR
jgi:uncharacterized protein (DUF1778 family)